MRSTNRRFLVWTIASLASVSAADARAEVPYDTGWDSGPPTCSSPMTVPRLDALAVPANVPALAFETTKVSGSGVATIEDMVVEAPGGTLVPTTLEPDPAMAGYTLVRIAGPLGTVGGAHSMRWNERCVLSGADGPTTTPRVRTFYVGDAVSPPFEIGAMYPSATYPELRIKIVFSAEMRQFGPVASIAYGLFGDPPPPAYGYGALDAVSLDVRFDPCIGRNGPTARTFELKAHIAGSAFDPPPLTKTFDVTCPGAAIDADVVPDTTMPEPSVDSSSSTESAVDAGDDEETERADETVRAGCPCSAGRHGSKNDAAALVAFALLVIAWRRHRSGRTTDPR